MYISETVRREIEAMQMEEAPQKKPLKIFGKLKLIVYLCFVILTFKHQ